MGISSAKRIVLLSAALLSLMACIPVAAWDSEGHEIVARLAYDHLNPKARAVVDQLAAEIQNPEKRYNAITVACWMDDLRKGPPGMPYHGMFSSWHYIDIPIDPRDPMPAFEPGADTDQHGNIVQALKRAIVVLNGGTDPFIPSKAVACAMVMHLAGDLSQPLHCATKYYFSSGKLRSDRGGNDEIVLNAPTEPPGSPPFSLHFFWDQAYRASFDPTTGNIIIDPHANMEQIRSTGPIPASSTIDIDAWARASNDLARTFVYPQITVADDKKHCRFSSEYVTKARAIASAQLRLSAVYLALLLNSTLGVDP